MWFALPLLLSQVQVDRNERHRTIKILDFCNKHPHLEYENYNSISSYDNKSNNFSHFFAMAICDALRDLVPSVQFKKREKNPWRSVNFSKVAG